MKKKLSISILIIACAMQLGKAQNMTQSELLSRPTDSSIIVRCLFDTTIQIRAVYGITPGIYSNQTAWITYSSNQSADVLISDLAPNTKYYYRIHYRYPNDATFITRPEFTFTTQRPKGNAFTFIVQADPHMDEQSDTALYTLTLKNELEDNPDFMIDLGDFIMTDKLKNKSNVITRDTISYRCKLLRKHYEKSCHSIPLFIALGNHEGESGWYRNGTPNNIAVWDALERKKFFANPIPSRFYTGDTANNQYIGLRENYYAWEWGDALFIVLDPYWYTNPKPDSLNGWRWTLGKTQYNWLKQTLESSKSAYKFVFSHQIIGGDPDGRGGVEYADLYEWGGNNLDGTPGFAAKRPGWYKPIKDLLTENRVNIFFHGHDHFFGKQEKDCMIYQETPQPSHPNFSTVNYAATYGYKTGQILPQSGHLRINVSTAGVKVEYIRAYLPKNETASRKNKDVSSTYFIGAKNCYDSVSTGVPVLWNADYADEVVYPNPFSSETNIEFSLAIEENIELSIYNEKGQLVRKLIDNYKVADGKYRIIWDGKNFLNMEQPNGLYTYIIKGSISGIQKGNIGLLKN